MPVYTFETNYAASGTEATATLTNIAASVGKIKKVSLQFPAGCIFLVKLKIFHRGRQILPTNPDGYFAGDDTNLEFQPEEDIKNTPSVLTIKGWNEDSSTHKIEGTITIER